MMYFQIKEALMAVDAITDVSYGQHCMVVETDDYWFNIPDAKLQPLLLELQEHLDAPQTSIRIILERYGE